MIYWLMHVVICFCHCHVLLLIISVNVIAVINVIMSCNRLFRLVFIVHYNWCTLLLSVR